MHLSISVYNMGFSPGTFFCIPERVHFHLTIPYHDIGITFDISRSDSIRIGRHNAIHLKRIYITKATAEDIVHEITTIDIHEGIAIYRTILATAIDSVPDVRNNRLLQFCTTHIRIPFLCVLHTEVGIAIDCTKLSIVITLILGTAVATSIYRREDTSTQNRYRCGEIYQLIILILIFFIRAFIFNMNGSLLVVCGTRDLGYV